MTDKSMALAELLEKRMASQDFLRETLTFMLQELLEHVVTALLKNRLPWSDPRNVSTSAIATESGLWEPALGTSTTRSPNCTRVATFSVFWTRDG